MKVLHFITVCFNVSYRLTYYVGGHTKDITGTRRREVMKRFGEVKHAGLWTLYKSGPFCIHERPVNWGNGARS